MNTEPHQQHQWLKKFIGEWTIDMGPGCQPPESAGQQAQPESVEVVRPIGGLWILGESTGVMPDGEPYSMILTLGFDPSTGRFTGTWIGSMMSYLWVYDGELDASGRILTLHAKGPDMADPSRMANYKDIVEFVTDDHRVLTSQSEGADGEWKQFMTMNFRRKK